MSNINVKLVKLLHYIIIFFIIIIPFTNNEKYIELNILFLSYALLKWVFGYNKCGLTQLEYLLNNKPYGEGFIYRHLNKIFLMDECETNKMLNIVTFIWLIVNIIIYKKFI